MHQIKLVIFDLDGTLIDAYAAVYRSLNHVMRQIHRPRVGHAMVKRSVGWGDRNLLGRFVGSAELGQALAIYRRHHDATLESGVRFLPGAKQAIRQLKSKGYILSVASNRTTRSAEIILKYLKVRGYFDCVVCGDQLKRFKPHPQILKHILKKTSLTPGEAIYIGDMAIDVETGHRAKIKTIAVVSGSSQRAEILQAKPLQVIENLRPVVSLIEQVYPLRPKCER